MFHSVAISHQVKKYAQLFAEAGSRRYGGGTETPRLLAASLGRRVLADRFLADLILLSVILAYASFAFKSARYVESGAGVLNDELTGVSPSHYMSRDLAEPGRSVHAPFNLSSKRV